MAWYKLVWFTNAIPKHSFILWLAVKGKSLTQDRMQAWQFEGNSNCVFCNQQKDSVDHLFFDCFFSQKICDYFSHLGVTFPRHLSWSALVELVSDQWKSNSLINVVNKIVLGSLVYFIWQERNLRLFQKQYRSSRQVVSCIVEVVRMKIRNNRRVYDTLRVWNISWELPLIQSKLNGLVLNGQF